MSGFQKSCAPFVRLFGVRHSFPVAELRAVGGWRLTDPRLDGTQRLFELLRDFTMSQPGEKRKLNRFPLPRIEGFDRTFHHLVALCLGSGLLGRRSRRGEINSRIERRSLLLFPPTSRSYVVDRPAARHHQQPARRRAALCAELARLLPDLNVDVQRDLLGSRPVPQNLENQPKNRRARQVIQPRHRRLVRLGDALDQLSPVRLGVRRLWPGLGDGHHWLHPSRLRSRDSDWISYLGKKSSNPQ